MKKIIITSLFLLGIISQNCFGQLKVDSVGHVGRNVTNTKAYGDVILGQGNITLKAKNVEIKNSTTVPLGTTLKIDK